MHTCHAYKLFYIGTLSLSVHSYSPKPEIRKGEVSASVVEPTSPEVMSQAPMPNVFLPTEVEKHLQLSEDLPSLTMNELAEELQLSYPVLSESVSPLNEEVFPTEHEEIVEIQGDYRLGKRRANQGEDEQAKKKTRFS